MSGHNGTEMSPLKGRFPSLRSKGGKPAGFRENNPYKKERDFLNPKESRRLVIMEKVLEGSISVPQAATLLNLSERHVFRLKGGMKKSGAASLAH